ncbi:unnamed protein product [Arabidopsis halleri]
MNLKMIFVEEMFGFANTYDGYEDEEYENDEDLVVEEEYHWGF